MAGGLANAVIAAGVRRLAGSPASSWVLSTAAVAVFNWLRGRGAKTEKIDLSGAAVGDKFVIEHLPITHKKQMKQFKSEAKAQKKQTKAARKAARPSRSTKREIRERERQLKAESRAAKAHQRDVARADRNAARQARTEAKAVKRQAALAPLRKF